MLKLSRLLAGWFVLIACTSLDAATALSVIRSTGESANLLVNGGFETASAGQPTAWGKAPDGFTLALNEGRDGSAALRCTRPDAHGWAGGSQTVVLDRATAAPLRIRGWSRAEDVSGGPDSGYALYVDLAYADGTPLWGQVGTFRCGTHSWEERAFVILPQQPVKSLTLHCLLRGHSGTVWFDDLVVEELVAPQGTILFQGAVVAPPSGSARLDATPASHLATSDGLTLERAGDSIVSVRVGGRDVTAQAPGGFLVRDVAANSDFVGFKQGACAELELRIDTEYRIAASHIAVRGRLTDESGSDRAVTLVFALPLEAAGWRWGDDVRRDRTITGQQEYAQTVGVRGGATGTLSAYPIAPVCDADTGLALGLDLASPALFRLGYQAGIRQLFIAYDFGLVRDSERFPGGAEFSFVMYRFEPDWGFRSAWQKYLAIFPEHFRVRSRDQGIWMPFTDVSRVEGWADFGFRYHEGNNNVPWDDAHGVLSFRYTEPMTWWMPMAKDVQRTPAEAIRIRDELDREGRPSQQRLAQVSRTAAMFDEGGEPCLLFRDEPWCQGAIWSLNPNPHLGMTAAGTATNEPLNAATVHWNDEVRDRLYGPQVPGRLDGEYLDSLEGYVTAELNFRRDHFRFTTVPLTFDTESRQPALFKGLAIFEFTRWMADDVHRIGKLMFANSVPYRFSFLCPWLDVMGTETVWLSQGRYRPAADAQMCLWRTLSGGKPYVLLMNTDYQAFGPDLVARYFQRCLFYGMLPSFFSHNAAENPYWQNSGWYNRDRARFKEYLPVIKRVAEAGWQPVTASRSENPHLWLERFGPSPDGSIYLTVFNDTPTPQEGNIALDTRRLDAARSPDPLQVVHGRNVDVCLHGWHVHLEPDEVAVLAVKTLPDKPEKGL